MTFLAVRRFDDQRIVLAAIDMAVAETVHARVEAGGVEYAVDVARAYAPIRAGIGFFERERLTALIATMTFSTV